MRFYLFLDIVKTLTLKEFMFSRIYGFLISILIFSDIIQYFYKIAGGPFYLMLYVYLILYGINFIYVYYVTLKKNLNIKVLLTIKQIFKNTFIYRFIIKYVDLLISLNINEIYIKRANVSIIGIFIKKILMNSFFCSKETKEIESVTANIMVLRYYLYKIPENWRY